MSHHAIHGHTIALCPVRTRQEAAATARLTCTVPAIVDTCEVVGLHC